ncbi:MAG: glycosyltransferase, partial [Deltaproteobacteria bacterium]|nr:glycosyltransferase [Deltaproteobacteria bacterium]
EPRKNHALLMDVFERIHHQYPWVKLVFIGKKGWNVDELIGRITEHSLYQKRLFWFSHVKDDMLSLFYKNCALSILPSFYEGYGLPVIESLMNGKIVLCSNKGSLPEVGGGYADYFDPSNAGTLEELLMKYLSSSKKRKEREAVVKYFTPYTWHESAEDLIHILEDFVSRKHLEKMKG